MRLIPNKLQLDVLKRHAGPFAFCFVTIIFLLLMQFLILHINKLIGKGLPWSAIIELIMTNLASMVVLAIPMAVLVACLMAYGKITELNELTALRAAGINPFHVISPVLAVSVLLSLFLVWFSNDVLPDANQRARSLFIDIQLKKPAFDLKPNEFYNGINNYTFLAKRITDQSDSLHNITIYQEATRKRKEAYIKAQKGHLEGGKSGQTFTLYLDNGSILRYLNRRKNGKNTKVAEKTQFDRYRISFDLSQLAFSRSNPEDRSRSDRTMNIQAMMTLVDSLNIQISDQKKRVVDNHNYITPVDANLEQHSYTPRRLGSHIADSLKKEPYTSKYLMLNQLDSKSAQNQLGTIALSNLRNYKSLYEDVVVDTDWRIHKVSQYLVEVHKKFSIPIACIVFVLLGAPIGMYTKKGNLGYAALIGTVFLTTYWISIIQGEKLADRLTITPFTGMWHSDIILGVIGIMMMIQICSPFNFSDLWKFRE